MKISEFKTLVVLAEQQFSSLKEKYPLLRAELVVCNGYGQGSLKASPVELFEQVASAFVRSEQFNECRLLLRTLRCLEAGNQNLRSDYVKKVAQALQLKIDSLLAELVLDNRSCIELRFKELDFELVAMLQRDPLVDTQLTPRSKASIRIVLDSLEGLKRRVASSPAETTL